jgi:methionyl aminopeptidase
MPDFRFTGAIRPAYHRPRRRDLPEELNRPDYWLTGEPLSEQTARANRDIEALGPKDQDKMRAVCRLGREVMDIGARMIVAGNTTEEIDDAVHAAALERGCYPSPLNYVGFPKSCCTSVNEVICHGIPDGRRLEDGDVCKLDVSLFKDGFHADLCETYFVGEIDDETRRLAQATHDSLWTAIRECKPGVPYRRMGQIIEEFIKPTKFSVVKSYCGHGVGRLFHCAPNVPHYAGNKAQGKMEPGHTFTIEPMINAGVYADRLWEFDNWTSATADGKWSAQFEHTLLITETGCEVLTRRGPNSRSLGIDESLSKGF